MLLSTFVVFLFAKVLQSAFSALVDCHSKNHTKYGESHALFGINYFPSPHIVDEHRLQKTYCNLGSKYDTNMMFRPGIKSN